MGYSISDPGYTSEMIHSVSNITKKRCNGSNEPVRRDRSALTPVIVKEIENKVDDEKRKLLSNQYLKKRKS